jgi:hypothetical protein
MIIKLPFFRVCQMVSNQNLNLGIGIWVLGMDNVGIFHGQFEHFTAIWYIL